jgi:hypothetical protein
MDDGMYGQLNKKIQKEDLLGLAGISSPFWMCWCGALLAA